MGASVFLAKHDGDVTTSHGVEFLRSGRALILRWGRRTSLRTGLFKPTIEGDVTAYTEGASRGTAFVISDRICAH